LRFEGLKKRRPQLTTANEHIFGDKESNAGVSIAGLKAIQIRTGGADVLRDAGQLNGPSKKDSLQVEAWMLLDTPTTARRRRG
jgi:hypothetical protein